jgi:hypothetical protein
MIRSAHYLAGRERGVEMGRFSRDDTWQESVERVARNCLSSYPCRTSIGPGDEEFLTGFRIGYRISFENPGRPLPPVEDDEAYAVMGS